jgi:hypothetical protein
MKNTLKCNITGTERVTNVPYLNKKADRLGISVEDYKANYVSKAALGNLKAEIAETSITDVAMKLGTTQGQVEAYINFNGKNKYIAPASVPTTQEEDFVPTELTTA